MYFLSTVCPLNGVRALLAKEILDKIGTKQIFKKNCEKVFLLALAAKDVLTSKGAQNGKSHSKISGSRAGAKYVQMFCKNTRFLQ